MNASHGLAAILRSLLLASLALVTLAAQAGAQEERIQDFDSQIRIHTDGSLTVTETISVWATGDQIKRGIYRDFPTIYENPAGLPDVVGFEVESVKRDGRPETYSTERRSNGVRVYIGDKDVFLDPGPYTYTLTYSTTRQITYGDAVDELAWNVTGNGWVFAIEMASATVHLPDGVEVREFAAYTGPFGARGTDYVAERTDARTVRFQTTQHLAPAEGLTVAASWPAGHVTRPEPIDNIVDLLLSLPVVIICVVAFAVLLIYYVAVWFAVGRDPARGAIVALYEPPKSLSPAATRYVRQQTVDDKTLTAAVISLAVKGHILIEDSAKTYTLSQRESPEPISAGERAVLGGLFTTHDKSIDLVSSNHEVLSTAKRGLSAALGGEYDKANFTNHIGYVAVGVLITLISIIVMGFFVHDPGAFVGFMVMLIAFQAVGSALITHVLVSKLGFRKFTLAYTVIDTVLLLILAAFLVVPAIIIAVSESTGMGAGAVIIIAMNTLTAIFGHLIEAPTRAGRKLLDRIAGFREYLSTAEQDRLDTLTPPDRTPELFERFLPYAVALGVENRWGEAFADVILPEKGWHPRWYHGRRFGHDSRTFSSGVGDAFSSAISSASSSPSSGSGGFSSGGGSSGGGGGGGGGGGW